MSNYQFCKKSDSLLGLLSQNQGVTVKHSQSAYFNESHAISQINCLYQYILNTLFQNEPALRLSQLHYSSHRKDDISEKILHMQSIFKLLLNANNRHNLQQNEQQENNQCSECSDYQQCLQKIEGQVRQHVRLEQQLRLYQQSLQEKLEQKQQQINTIKQQNIKFAQTLQAFQSKQANLVEKANKINYQLRHMEQCSCKADKNTQANVLNSVQSRKSLKPLKQNKQIQNLGQLRNKSQTRVERQKMGRNKTITSTKLLPLNQKSSNIDKQTKHKMYKNRIQFQR